mmetsp:Transcript_720/g.2757  ORF Transcript_720/g.2757 Transcript_720/m.2757 type:complete len:266 (+) Transcript_720:406-1203(+)
MSTTRETRETRLGSRHVLHDPRHVDPQRQQREARGGVQAPHAARDERVGGGACESEPLASVPDAEQDGQRDELRGCFPLPERVHGDRLVRLAARGGGPLADRAHRDLAADDDRRRRRHGDGGDAGGGFRAQQHQRGGHHEFVRDGIEKRAERRHQVHLAREIAVEPVRDRGEHEDGAARRRDPRALHVEDHRHQGHRRDAHQRERRGQVDLGAAGRGRGRGVAVGGADGGAGARRAAAGGGGRRGHGAIEREEPARGRDGGPGRG